MLHFPEPLNSIDPVDWLVYADWLADQGDDTEDRARRIAAVLASGRTGLWLEWGNGSGQWAVSSLHYPDTWDLMAELGTASYRWRTHSEWRWGDQYASVSPAERPAYFRFRADVARAFFDRLAELGPLVLVGAQGLIHVPTAVAVCPGCACTLLADVQRPAWPDGTQELVADYVYCSRSRRCRHDLDLLRRKAAIGKWRSVQETVQHWVRDHVRLRAG